VNGMAVKGTAVPAARWLRAWLETAAVLGAALLLRVLLEPLLDGNLPYLGLYLGTIVLMLRRGLPYTVAMLAAGALITEWLGGERFVPPDVWDATRAQRLRVFGVACAFLLPMLQALRRSREQQRVAGQADRRLAQVVRQANDAILSLDTEGRVQSWNPAAERIFGWSEAEMRGQTLSLLADPQQQAGQRALVAEVAAGHTVTTEITRRHKDGHLLQLRLSAAPMFDDAQRFVGISGVLQDVGEQRRAEQALRDSEALLRAFYDNAPVCMGVVELVGDDDVLHLYDNRVTCEVFGVPPGGTAQRLSSELGSLPSTRRKWIRHYRASLTLGPQQFDYTLEGKDGETTRWMSATVCPLGPGPSGRERFCYVSEDITPRKRNEQRLREDDRQKDEFLAVLAHELRNPLSPLVTGVQLLRKQDDDAKARERSLAMMDRQLGHMVRMVNDLLDISRITQGRMTLTRTPVALQAVIDDALEASRALLQQQSHRLKVQVDDALVVNADPTRLAQVLANLLNNAAKYTPPGGDIELRARRQGESVVLCVADNGIGIPADQLHRVFELFAQVPDGAVRAMGGLGIGLSIARKLVELHGGTLEAASEGRGRGSRFTVTLPLAVLPERPAAPDSATRAPRLRLVVADDNRDAAFSLAELLQLEGHEVHVVHDGLQAVQAAQTLQPDAMLLDIGMPRLDGLQAAARIRAGANASAGARGPLLIAVSGWGQQADVQRSAAAGFDHHLTKPVRMEELRAVLPT
jgi:PAS domain S-box-containing protein